MDTTTRKAVLVGIVFVVGLIILIGISLRARQASTVRGGYTLYASFERVNGLEKGSLVKVAGVDIGVVNHLEFDQEKGKALVTASVSPDVSLPNDSVAEVTAGSLLGQSFLTINYGTQSAPSLKEGDFLVTKDSVSLGEMIGILGDASKDLQDFIASLDENQQDVLGKLSDVIDENRQNLKEATEALANVAPRLEDAIDAVEEITTSVREGEGTIGKLFKDDQLYEDLSALATELQSITQDMKKGESTIGKLFADDNLYNDAQAMVTEIKSAAESVSQIVTENREDIDKALVSISDIGPKLETTLKNLEEVSNKLNEGEGTFAKLVNDPTLYDRVNETLKKIRDSFEESEEQSVMRTMLSVIVGAGF